jgi:L-threonylcarbamoyladenylate synthase
MADPPPEHQRLAGPEEIARAVEILVRGGVIAFPTETVYGLGADAFSADAVAQVFRLKGRPSHNPLIVHVSGEAVAGECAGHWPSEAHRLARMFWPGPLTIVVPRSARVPDVVSGGGPTVALRCPDHHLTLALLETFGGPLVGPSANRSGQVSPTTAAHVRESFSADDVYVLDGGPCRGGIESTVVTLAEARPRILRPGLVSAEELEIVLGCPVESPAPGEVHSGPAPSPSPGMLGSHYAPAAPAVLFQAEHWPDVITGLDGPAVVLAISPLAVPQGHTVIDMPGEAGAYAARLYAALREADALRPVLIAIERPPGVGDTSAPSCQRAIWQAVMDRLRRATAG